MYTACSVSSSDNVMMAIYVLDSDSVFLPQEMSVGYANGIRVMSMTHTGEPGFMLYIPIEVNVTPHHPLRRRHLI